MIKYGKRWQTEWAWLCQNHVEGCNDANCHVKNLMKLWNNEGGLGIGGDKKKWRIDEKSKEEVSE